MLRGEGSAGEEVVDLSDSGARDARFGESVQQRFGRRLDRIVPPVRRSLIAARRRRERTRDHTGHIVRWLQYRPRDLAGAVELVERNISFVGRDLENRVCRRVDDPLSCCAVFVPVTIDHIRSAANDVSNHASPRLARERLDYVRWKPIRESRKRSLDVYAGYLPVPGRAVLAGRSRTHRSPSPRSISTPLESLDGSNVAKPHALESRKLESAAGAGDVAQRVASHVAVRGGVRRFADADPVENQDDGALQAPGPK